MSFHRILIALDDSAIAAHAVEVGTELATALKAQAALVSPTDRRATCMAVPARRETR